MASKQKDDFLVSRANVRRENDGSRRWSRSLLQTVVSAAEDVRLPHDVLVRGATKVMTSEDCNARHLMVLVGMDWSRRQDMAATVHGTP